MAMAIPGTAAAGLILLGLLASVAAHGSDAVEDATRWVRELPRGVVYDDGYTPRQDPSLLTMQGQLSMLPAVYLTFFDAAWKAFIGRGELSAEQLDPRHYKAGFELRDGILTVTIQGLLLPRLADGEPVDVLRVSLGPSALYRFDFESRQLLESLLLR